LSLFPSDLSWSEYNLITYWHVIKMRDCHLTACTYSLPFTHISVIFSICDLRWNHAMLTTGSFNMVELLLYFDSICQALYSICCMPAFSYPALEFYMTYLLPVRILPVQ
jgi:hypothetical protein